MIDRAGAELSRRALLRGGALLAAGMAAAPATALMPSLSGIPSATPGPRSALLTSALGALQRHGARIPRRDVIGLVDFAVHSGTPRFHLVDLASGRSSSMLVAHGRGSDPEHTGFLQRFSNVNGSEASSEGAYLTSDLYTGKHGRSRRLVGLDSTNSNVEARAIVIHSAWYVSPEVLRANGQIGRSEGCLAVSAGDLDEVLARLGPGHMIYADKA